MLYLEDYVELIEHLPSDLRDRFSDMRDMDLQVSLISKRWFCKCTIFVSVVIWVCLYTLKSDNMYLLGDKHDIFEMEACVTNGLNRSREKEKIGRLQSGLTILSQRSPYMSLRLASIVI